MESQDDDDKDKDSLFFHERCLAANAYVKYDQANNKWLNIATAIKHLVQNKKFTCYRCLQPGATIQCLMCDRKFHGHYCNKMYMLSNDYEDKSYICIFCKNTSNYQESTGSMRKEIKSFAIDNAAKIRKKINKSHIIESKAYSRDNFYVPQICDEVMYFFQGHEKFYQNNNCFFYCGNQKSLSSKDLPWMGIP